MLTVILAATALAHPFQPSAWSMRTSVKAEGDALDIVVALEAPTFVVLKALVDKTGATTGGFNKAEVEKARDDFNDATWDTLSRSLSVTIDGAPVPMVFEAVDTPINGKANDQFFLYLVEGRWELPRRPGAVAVSVRNTAYPDEPMYLTAQPLARSPWTVDDASSELLLRLGECLPDDAEPDIDAVDVDEEGEVWLKDDRLRTLDVVFQRG